ncbi:MAG: hypothetical protein ACM3SM_09865 [Bacteroidota bacterium]
MGGIQSVLAIGAMLLLTLTTINFNSAYLNNSTVEIENKVMMTAFSLADDMIEEIKIRSFDEKTVQFTSANPSDLTPSSSLGPETGESYATFDDIDDFNGYTKSISAPHAENYSIRCKIEYVSATAPDNVSSTQTFYKRAKITVSSPYLRHSINLSYIFTLK